MDASTTQQHPATEMTENSLLDLLVQDLFVQQRDSKEVREIIQGSEKLQKKMFLVLSYTPTEHWAVIQRHRAPSFFKLIDSSKHSGDEPRATPVTLNPLLQVVQVVTSNPAKVTCIQRTFWGTTKILLASYVFDPPCREAVVSVDFRINRQTSTSRPEAHPHSASARDVTVKSQTGLTLGMLLEGALNASGEYRVKDQHGIIRPRGVPNLRELLESLENPRIVLELPWEFELVNVLESAHVVVPTAEEWAQVRQRGARGK